MRKFNNSQPIENGKRRVFHYMAKQTDEEIEQTRQLWRDYKKNPTPEVHAILIKKYEPLVHKIASGFLYKRPSVLDYDDLISSGTMGLLDAIEKFDPDNDRKAQFQTYATFRIRGSILDEINSMDWTPRSVRQNIRGVLASIEQHYKVSQEEPTLDQIAAGSEIGRDAAREILQQMNKTFIVHVEQETMDLVGPSTNPDDADIERAVNLAVDSILDGDEKAYVHLKFYVGYSNKEIQGMMGIKPNELKNIKDSALAKLANALHDAV